MCLLQRQLNSQKMVKEAIRRLNKLTNRQRDGLPGGVSCEFMTLSRRIGVKVFWSRKERNNAVKMQSQAAKIGLGPLVGLSFSMRWKKNDWKVVYCHLTEKVKACLCDDFIDGDSTADDLFEDIYEKFLEYRIRAMDLHEENVGIKNHKYVVIDFAYFEKISKKEWKNEYV